MQPRLDIQHIWTHNPNWLNGTILSIAHNLAHIFPTPGMQPPKRAASLLHFCHIVMARRPADVMGWSYHQNVAHVLRAHVAIIVDVAQVELWAAYRNSPNADLYGNTEIEYATRFSFWAADAIEAYCQLLEADTLKEKRQTQEDKLNAQTD